MITSWPWPLRVAFFAVVVLLYYRYTKRALFAACQRLAQRLPAGRRYSQSEIGGVLELTAAAFSHVVVVLVLLALAGLPAGSLHLWPVPWALLPLGVLIGIGQFALASFVCRVVIDVSMIRRPATAGDGRLPAAAPASMAGWLTMARGGWLRHHLKTMEIVPAPVAMLLTGVQVASEELVFRAIMMGSLRDAGMAVAVTFPCLLFIGMQAFFMPTWRAAMFPMVGATIMGIVHGMLFWYAPAVLPLAVAHVSFFFIAVL